MKTQIVVTALRDIVASVAAGNHHAFRKFYDLYYLKVYRFVYYFLQDTNDCETVVSDIFCLLWEKRGLLSNVENIDAYVYQISRHQSFHYLKKKKNEQFVSFDDLFVETPFTANNSVEDALTEKEMMQVYWFAVGKLPERCKEVFLMVREEKLSHKEVSDIMGITPGTIEIQMNIAIRKIAGFVKNYYPQLMTQGR